MGAAETFEVLAEPNRLRILELLLVAERPVGDLVAVLDVTQDVAWKFGELRATLLDGGLIVPELDLFNASVASVYSFTMVTHNTADYASVPGLTLADWLLP